jgi:NAD(P)-dependent dehydrogenase (short-subunit alcohol dehydrogenase family)
VKQDNLQIDLLVLNAGIMALPTREETADGFEKQVRRTSRARLFSVFFACRAYAA